MTTSAAAEAPRAAAAPALIAHCRAGFEAEAAADLAVIGGAAGTRLTVDAPLGRGFVVGVPARFDRARILHALADVTPIFIRSLFVGTGPHTLFEATASTRRPDRVVPLVALVATLGGATSARGAYAELRLETPDTNDGKELSGLCRALAAPLAAALAARGLPIVPDDASKEPTRSRLHVLFVDGAHVYVGTSTPPWSSRWPMGIPRIRVPHGAPSRSAGKLAEALLTLVEEHDPPLLRAGMRAVDLGAAPGGWTWLLAERGVRVTAVDNGPLKGEVAQDPLVTHLRADGFHYRPRRPVDWMVCDIADQPARIAALVGRWMAAGEARRVIFNLKLPMKKRHDEVHRCLALITDALRKAPARYSLVVRQLYHDREEVTGYCARID